ncbi:Bifunctional purine biosynthesis protein PurH [subsurface metagenome]
MSDFIKINSALISVYHKENLDNIIHLLKDLGVRIYSTGGTQNYIKNLGAEVIAVEDLTGYPSILGGRVKTLHPKVFGGILARRDSGENKKELLEYQIPEIDLVIVDLYPFEETVASGADEQSVIEKIDIGGISLIRAAAKNYNDVVIISNKDQYEELKQILQNKKGKTTLEERRKFATEAFDISSHYDTAIFKYFNAENQVKSFKESVRTGYALRYGENPHQKGVFYGDFDKLFDKLHGKEISYNNLLDIDAAVNLMSEFSEPSFAILKHNNACGIASGNELLQLWKDAIAGDPVSAFGGILISNVKVNKETAEEINKIFFEVIIAPEYQGDALEILKQKKNRIILVQKSAGSGNYLYRSLLNGVIYQDRDMKIENETDLETVTKKKPSASEITDLIFANKLVKNTKSNCIVLAKGKQLIASGVGQTSRVDALKQAIVKAGNFKFDLNGAVMASDAFFPFADSVEIAYDAGITAVIQPGGSIRDKDSIDFCDKHNMSMVFTGIRHFKH